MKKRDYPRNTPFWSLVTLAALGGLVVSGGVFLWKSLTKLAAVATDRENADSVRPPPMPSNG